MGREGEARSRAGAEGAVEGRILVAVTCTRILSQIPRPSRSLSVLGLTPVIWLAEVQEDRSTPEVV